MSQINIRRAHQLSLLEAHAATEQMAKQLDARFELRHHWQGSRLHFERSGVSGHIDVDTSEVRIYARLGFLLSPLKGRFERAIHEHLDELLNTD
jgi:putative polyhydroxyalkanoate system protein